MHKLRLPSDSAWAREFASFYRSLTARMESVVADRNRPRKLVRQARTIPRSADRLSVTGIARRAGVSRLAMLRWQLRFAEESVDGLLRDKTRPPGKPSLSAATVSRVIILVCSEPPGEVTHRTGRAVTRAG